MYERVYLLYTVHAEKIHVSESFFLFHSHLFKTTNVQTFFVRGPGAAWIKAHPLPLIIISLGCSIQHWGKVVGQSGGYPGADCRAIFKVIRPRNVMLLQHLWPRTNFTNSAEGKVVVYLLLSIIFELY